MDTLSRDSSSSSNNILPIVAIALGGIGLVVGAFGMIKATKVEKAQVEINTKIQELTDATAGIRSDIQRVDSKVDSSVASLRQGVEQVLGQVSAEMGTIKGQLAKIEEAQKAKATAPAGTTKGGKVVATGTVDANGNYTVAPGDTISKIARKFAVKADSIEADNPGLDPTKLRVGQKIKIPKK